MRYGSSNLTPNSIKNCNVACNRSEVSAQGVAPVAAETLVVVPCACSNKKDKRKQMYARVKECLLEDSCRSEWYSRQSYFSNWIISCTWASIVGSAWILCIPGQLWRFKYSPTSVGLGLWSPVPTILGANFRLCRHLTFSADSPPPTCSRRACRIFENDAVYRLLSIGAASSSGTRWPQVASIYRQSAADYLH